MTEIKNLDLYKEIKDTRHGRQNPTVLSLIPRRDKCVSQFRQALVFAEEYKKYDTYNSSNLREKCHEIQGRKALG